MGFWISHLSNYTQVSLRFFQHAKYYPQWICTWNDCRLFLIVNNHYLCKCTNTNPFEICPWNEILDEGESLSQLVNARLMMIEVVKQ